VNPIVVIPARMASNRLPGKPLADIHGKPMIVHVMERGREAGIGPVVVAAGDPEIAEAVRQAGGTAVLTNPDLPRGSDRVHAALSVIDPGQRHDVVVNLQGDLPTIPPAYLRSVLLPLTDPDFDIGTLVAVFDTAEQEALASVPKVACAFVPGRTIAPALYFSRNPIPWGDGPRWHHIGIYAFRRTALDRFVATPESPLELRESLEQLRALEVGMRIGCVRVDHAPFGVDIEADLERARVALAPRDTTFPSGAKP
jgi:3-deoxy-manno-octulosonate cytidylyltransferase (CMP-KDO synthetase)